MPIFKFLPHNMKSCCWCITDLKAAVAIIIIFGIVTSPAISWALIRHSYVIRVSCHVSTSSGRQDIVDVNLNNVLSFGFGANAGLGPSCMQPKKEEEKKEEKTDDKKNSVMVKVVKYFGWTLLAVDIIFLICSIVLLMRLYKGVFVKILRLYMYSLAISVFLSFVYGLLYVTLCCVIGGSFPLFEFFFTIFDLVFVFVWIYLILVIREVLYDVEHGEPKGYLRPIPKSYFQRLKEMLFSYRDLFWSRFSWFESLYSFLTRLTTGQQGR